MKPVKEAVSARNADEAMAKAEELSKVLQEVGAALYASTEGSQTTTSEPHPEPGVGEGSGEPRPSGSGPRGKVVDAEFREND